jgi:hypothetical protein
MMRKPSLTLTAVAGALALSGCQTFSPDAGRSVPMTLAGQHLNKEVVALRSEEVVVAARAKVDRLLKRPLTANSAIQIALLNNRRHQATYNELGIAHESAAVTAAQSGDRDCTHLWLG